MADTRAQLQAEKWIVAKFLPELFHGLAFSERKVELKWGGSFSFDAVSHDGEIVGLVSTSSARTAGGNLATAKIQKLKCDTLYLLNAISAKKLLLIFTEETMLNHYKKEVANGRFPPEVQLIHAPLPVELYNQVLVARASAVSEVSPSKL